VVCLLTTAQRPVAFSSGVTSCGGATDLQQQQQQPEPLWQAAAPLNHTVYQFYQVISAILVAFTLIRLTQTGGVKEFTKRRK